MVDESVGGGGAVGGGVPDAALRKALAFAVKVAAGFSRPNSPVPVPVGLRAYVRVQRLTPAALRAVRAVVDADDGFRLEVARRATPDHVDEIGRLWLARPEGWTRGVADLLEQQEATAAAAAATSAVTTIEAKRREAAERRADDLKVQRDEALRRVGELTTLADGLAAERDRLAEQVRRLTQQRAEEERARARRAAESSAADDRAKAEGDELQRLRILLEETEKARDAALESWVDEADPIDLDALRSLLGTASRLVAPSAASRSARTPMSIPGGLHGDDVAVAERFFRTAGVEVFVDGYNVAKRAWPGLDLRQQRDRLVEMCERLARRFGTHVTVVFDGAQVTGAHAAGQRFVKVVYTVPGELADDRLRTLVRNLGHQMKVVVVTSDGEVRRSVQEMGANLLANHVLPELDRR